MNSGTRIPLSIPAFASYIANTYSFLLAGTPQNYTRFNIQSAELATWGNFATQFGALYPKYTDKKNSRTTAIKDQLLLIIKNCMLFNQTNHFLDRIAASPTVTIADMETFNIKSSVFRKTTRTIMQTPISDSVAASILPLSGGTLAIKCRSQQGIKAAIVDGADCVQYCYIVGNTPPTAADTEGQRKEISTKASFTLNLGTDACSKIAYFYFRWYNTRHPDNAGPWSSLMAMLVL